MRSMTKVLLGAAMAVGALAMTAAPAQAARIGVYIGGPVAYIPPCPGPGYVWVDGYYNGGVWIPGYWNFVGVGVRVGPPVVRYYDRGPVFRGYVGPERGRIGHFRR